MREESVVAVATRFIIGRPGLSVLLIASLFVKINTILKPSSKCDISDHTIEEELIKTGIFNADSFAKTLIAFYRIGYLNVNLIDFLHISLLLSIKLISTFKDS